MEKRIKKSHYHADMLSVEEARENILSKFSKLETEKTPILKSLGSVISEDIFSEIDVPPWNNSAMDGYAVIKNDLLNASEENLIFLKVVEEIAAGQIPNKTLINGETSRIMTGAPIPQNADAVVPFEDTNELERKSLKKIGIKINVDHFENIRKKSEDIKKGSIVLKKGTIITAASIGLLASIGFNIVPTIRKPVIGILSTGNELIEPGQKNEPGKIFNSNSYTITSLIESYGAIPVLQSHAEDNIKDLEKKLLNFIDVDLIVTSAGVSKGDYDVVKDVLSKNGDINFWSVNMRPAKPLAFGIISLNNKKIPLLGLPGNPVSAMIALEKFGRYAIDKMMGKSIRHKPIIKAFLDSDIINHDGRRLYARVIVSRESNSKLIAKPIRNQSSGVLSSMTRADALLVFPEEATEMRVGEEALVQLLNDHPYSENHLGF